MLPLVQLSLKFPACVAENVALTVSGVGSDAVLPSRLLLVSSSAQEDDRLCHSDLGAAMKLSRVVSFMLQLVEVKKEEAGLAASVLPRLGREEKGLGKVRGKPFCSLPARGEWHNQLTVLPRQVSSAIGLVVP